MSGADGERRFARPIWDRGEPLDPAVLAFTAGDDWRMDRRLVRADLRGSLAHVEGLLEAGLVDARDGALLREGLEALLAAHRAGEWDVGPEDEDVHSAVERRLTERIGPAGGRLHTGRSRNDQIALDLRLWLRDEALPETGALLDGLRAVARALRARDGALPLPGYTHLRRAMPSSVGDWLGAFEAALEQDAGDLEHVRARLARSPLGSGAGYGVPLALPREANARRLGFEGAEEPVTLAQWSRGRAELAYLTALEGLALDLGKLAFDLWLYTSAEFGFARLPSALTTGSSLMPQKRNPDVLELLRAHARQVAAERAALLDVLRDLPSGYHRDFQLLKPPLLRAHDRMAALLAMSERVLGALELDRDALAKASADPSLHASARALRLAAEGLPFREAYARVAKEGRPPEA